MANYYQENDAAETAPVIEIQVYYWRGTTRMMGIAHSYAEAMEIASQNQNTYSPSFYHGNRELVDDGQGLCYRDALDEDITEYAV